MLKKIKKIPFWKFNQLDNIESEAEGFRKICPICSGDMQFFKEDELSLEWRIKYHICLNCGLIHSFDHAFFRTVLYEGDYFSDVDSGWNERGDEIFEVFDRHFRGIKPLKILDLGAGKNYFVSRLLQAGYDAYGVDTNSEPEFAKDRFYRNLAELPYDSFDVIVLIEVVEHLISPLKEIEKSTRYLSPNGKIFLTTVVFHERYKDSTNWYINPRFGHVTIWSMRALSKIFFKFGFVSASIYRSGNIQIWDRMPNSIFNRWYIQCLIFPVRSMVGRIRFQLLRKIS